MNKLRISSHFLNNKALEYGNYIFDNSFSISALLKSIV